MNAMAGKSRRLGRSGGRSFSPLNKQRDVAHHQQRCVRQRSRLCTSNSNGSGDGDGNGNCNGNADVNGSTHVAAEYA
jgi:hypothetical protein